MWISQKGMLTSRVASFLWSSLSFGPLAQDAWLFCLFEQQDKQSLLWVFLSSKTAWLRTGSLPENVTWNSSGRFILVWAERELYPLFYYFKRAVSICHSWAGLWMEYEGYYLIYFVQTLCECCRYIVLWIWVSAVVAVQTHSINIQYAIDSAVFLLYI